MVRSILKQCVQKSNLKVIQIGLQLGTAILRVGCQAQDSKLSVNKWTLSKDLRSEKPPNCSIVATYC